MEKPDLILYGAVTKLLDLARDLRNRAMNWLMGRISTALRSIANRNR
jgi:hypothetical protein